MNAMEIIDLLRANGASTDEALLAVLEDGEALVALGITDAEQVEVEAAYNMIQNDGLNFTLNEAGQKELLAEILEAASEKLINPTAYFEDAENDASRWNSGEDASIELSKLHTKSGNPEIIKLKKEWFDSEAIDQE